MFRTTLAAIAIAAAAAPAAAQNFTSDRITVRAEGKGRDVVLVPGLGSNPAVWKHVAADVPGHRYHYVQVKGFAGTAPEANATGDVAAPVAAEIARYIKANNLKAPAIVGHSMGGTIAMMVAARNPGAVSRVMIVDMFPFLGMMFGGPTATPASVAPIADGIVAQMKAATPEQRIAFQTQSIKSMVNDAAEIDQVVQAGLASNPTTTGNAYRELLVTDLRPELVNIAVPTTVLYVTPKGAPMTDAQIDMAYQGSYANLKGATLTRIPNSAHFITYDARPRFAAELKAFLAK